MIKFIAIGLLLTACIKKEENHYHECRPAKKQPTGFVKDVEQTLINGDVVDPKDFPATFKTTIGSSWCTGTLIGPRVLQLASHCVPNGGKASFTSNGVTYTGTCQRHPAYNGDETADYALCYLDKVADVAFYETITHEEVAIGETIYLAGYGCKYPGGNDKPDGKLRVGPTEVVGLPIDDNDIVTEKNAALCYGDSGGSVFKKDSKGVLKVVAINSRGDIETTSYLPALYTVPAKSFYISWAAGKKAFICGLSGDDPKCRGYVAPEPPPAPEPSPSPSPTPTPLPDLPEC